MSVGPLKGQTVYVPSLVCQKEQISFEELCATMVEDSTVGEADVAAVFYKARNVLNRFCSLGYIVDAGPFGKFYPTITSRVVTDIKDFNASEHIKRAQMRFCPDEGFPRFEGCRVSQSAETGQKEERKDSTQAIEFRMIVLTRNDQLRVCIRI